MLKSVPISAESLEFTNKFNDLIIPAKIVAKQKMIVTVIKRLIPESKFKDDIKNLTALLLEAFSGSVINNRKGIREDNEIISAKALTKINIKAKLSWPLSFLESRGYILKITEKFLLNFLFFVMPIFSFKTLELLIPQDLSPLN